MVAHYVYYPARRVEGVVQCQCYGTVIRMHTHSPGRVLIGHILNYVRVLRGQLIRRRRLGSTTTADHTARNSFPLKPKAKISELLKLPNQQGKD